MPYKCHSFLPFQNAKLTHVIPALGHPGETVKNIPTNKVRHELGDSSHPWLGALWLHRNQKGKTKNRFGKKNIYVLKICLEIILPELA